MRSHTIALLYSCALELRSSYKLTLSGIILYALQGSLDLKPIEFVSPACTCSSTHVLLFSQDLKFLSRVLRKRFLVAIWHIAFVSHFRLNHGEHNLVGPCQISFISNPHLPCDIHALPQRLQFTAPLSTRHMYTSTVLHFMHATLLDQYRSTALF